jgi:hypothetical protein
MDIEKISLKKLVSYYYDQENSALNSEDYNIEGNEKTIYKITDHLISKSNLELAAALTFEMFNLEESKKNNFNIEKIKLLNSEEIESLCVTQESFKDDFDWPEEVQELKNTLNAIIKSSFLTLNLIKKILLNLNKDNWESDPEKVFDSNKDLTLNIYYSNKDQTKYLNANFEQLFNDNESSYMVFTYPVDLNPESVEVYCCHIDQNRKLSENQKNTICNYLEQRKNTPIFVLQCKY